MRCEEPGGGARRATMSTRTYELTVPVRKGERGMGIVVNPENCVIELAADGCG